MEYELRNTLFFFATKNNFNHQWKEKKKSFHIAARRLHLSLLSSVMQYGSVGLNNCWSIVTTVPLVPKDVCGTIGIQSSALLMKGCMRSHCITREIRLNIVDNPIYKVQKAMLILCICFFVFSTMFLDTSPSAGCAQMGCWYDKF